MNEKLVGWFEDILPEIKKTNDVKGTMLKFANDKNIAPALLEKLGHVYNTAKTVTYLDKCASQNKGRGETFQVLDIPEMLEEYTQKKASDHEYSSNDYSSLSSGSFTDLFEGKVTFNDLNSLDESEDYKEVKIASDRRLEWKNDSIKIANLSQAEQLIFDNQEDNRKVASEISDYIRDSYNETSFEQIEQDAKYYFGDCIKEACDYVSAYMDGIGYAVKRASDSGKSRLLTDNTFLLKFAFIQNNLNTIEQADFYIQNNRKKKASAESSKVDENTKKPTDDSDESKKQDKEDGVRLDKIKKERTFSPAPAVAKDDWPDLATGKEKLKYLVGGAASGLSGLVAGGRHGLGLDKSLPDTVSSVRDTLTNFISDVAPSRNTGQELIDSDLDDAKYTSVIQDLIITDPILAEEDEDKVLDLYNTIKSVAPEMAKDKNVARVVLRSAVQYDGIAAPDLAQLVEAERSIQRSQANSSAIDSAKYDRNPSGHRIN